ncbi:MAG: hypothetical protein HFH87_17230, partial [Lachnospiraceae bacterium]|nr:hypothetical protein [Lachnospiraceae bacterium]
MCYKGMELTSWIRGDGKKKNMTGSCRTLSAGSGQEGVEMNLPESFISIAGKYGVEKEEIIFAGMADFDMEYRFADTIVALTKEKLLLAA